MSISSSYPNQGLVVLGTGPSSGINYTTILNAYQQSLSEPITLMQQQETPLNNQLSAWQTISGDVTSLSSAASALGQPSLFQTYTATSSNTSVATATASSSAIPGNYNITVNSLAQANIIASQGVASSSDTVGTGTFGITVNGTNTNITIDSTNDTLSGLAQAINNSTAGVTAAIINNGSSTNPYQLLLTSNNTGTNYSISTTNGLTGGTDSLSFTNIQSGMNASISYGSTNPITITGQSNTISDGIPGVTLNLSSNGSADISVGIDTQTIDSSANSFVSAYNQLVTDISAQQQYNSSTKSLGPLGGNSSLSGLVNTLYSFMGSEAPTLTGDAGLPSTYGITTNSSGSGQLSLDTATLNNMLTTNPQQVQQFFSALVNGSSTADGVSMPGGLTNSLNTYTNPANGVIHYSETQINTQLTNMNNQISLQQALVQQQMGMYTKEFSSLESYIGTMQTTNSNLADTIKQLPTW